VVADGEAILHSLIEGGSKRKARSQVEVKAKNAASHHGQKILVTQKIFVTEVR
jgi:hypothetical protein